MHSSAITTAQVNTVGEGKCIGSSIGEIQQLGGINPRLMDEQQQHAHYVGVLGSQQG